MATYSKEIKYRLHIPTYGNFTRGVTWYDLTLQVFRVKDEKKNFPNESVYKEFGESGFCIVERQKLLLLTLNLSVLGRFIHLIHVCI